jgi:hypothetical protein
MIFLLALAGDGNNRGDQNQRVGDALSSYSTVGVALSANPQGSINGNKNFICLGFTDIFIAFVLVSWTS